MKKVTIAVSVIIAIMIGFLVFIQNVNINRIGAESYYAQINDGKKMEEKSDSGQKMVYYEYTLQGFDKKGQGKMLTFTASKELRKEAFLCLYVKSKGVSSYQEVKADELPDKVKEKLKGTPAL
ncbi:membrane protein [Paenibacillus baekrokdamisoli]|uniref:Membrane protein n=1 Tax=Paenibacillus baekrokdamisoli TaxID=1712516 RepID=A0A3G9J9W3_9BACL|nr:YxeA family protein [Paenibacillus baekrokdamisoli]MBB3068327.1 uncharacterized protein (TIGR01655 family) [Paenibacillus baekrokdamisoli]BBH22631.1 membrane protein [Paenibacillus baekrokdamisoli]